MDKNIQARINLRSKNALSKLDNLSLSLQRLDLWKGITKVQKGRPYQISNKDYEEALETLGDLA